MFIVVLFMCLRIVPILFLILCLMLCFLICYIVYMCSYYYVLLLF